MTQRAVAIRALGWRLRVESRCIARFENILQLARLQTSSDPAAAGPLPKAATRSSPVKLLRLFKKLSPDQHSADLRGTGPDLISLGVA